MKNLFKTKKGGKQVRFVLFSLICLGGLGSCMDKNVEVNLPSYVASDPNVEVVFTDYSPLEGAVRTNMFINGSNFGTDPSLIRVVVGGKEAKVVSSSGTQIYCIVPSRADGGFVQVDILNKDKSLNATYTFEQKFSYQYNVVVGTLCGVVDSEGNTSITDGNFDKAGTQTPLAMYYDESSGERCIYFFETEHSLRKIYLDKDSIATVITNGAAGWSSAPSGLGWSVGRDTMFVNCPQGNVERAGAYYLLRKENFKNSYPALNGDDFNTLFTHPIDGTIFLCRGRDATLHKAVWNEKTQMWDPKQIAKMGPSGWFQCVTFHPSGNFAYLIARDKQCVMKAEYNWAGKYLETPITFAGEFGSYGYKDASQNSARFDNPMQGCFVLNEEYVAEQRLDVYDFYLTDAANHCIRKITPDGIVTTFAGRGSYSTDQIVSGYIDGDPRETARFNYPLGLCYEESTGTFYVGDNGNHRVRTIALQ